MSKIIKKILSGLLVSSMIISQAVVSYAAGGNYVNLNSRVGDKFVETVFLGETVETVLSFEDMEEYSNFDIVLVYNSDVIQLAPLTGTSIDTEYDFSNSNGCGISLAPYLQKNTSPVLEIAVPAIDAEGEKPAMGAIALSRQKKDGVDENDQPLKVAVTGDTEALLVSYKAIGVGQAGFRYAEGASDADRIYNETGWMDIGNAKQLVFPFAVNEQTNTFEVVEKPKKPVDPKWGAEGTSEEYNVTWQEPDTGARGYIVEIIVDGVSKQSIDVDGTKIELIPYIENIGSGEYEIMVSAKGGTYNSEPASCTKNIEKVPLNITSVVLEDKVLKWDPVTHADEYVITIVKDGETAKTEIPITDPAELQKDLSTLLGGVGDYTITLTAKSNGGFYSDASKDVRYESGSTVTGKVQLVIHNSPLYKANPDNKTSIIFTDKNDVEYTTECADDGSFSIANIPSDADGYTVTIKRNGAVTRTLCDTNGNAVKLVLTASIEKNICATDKTLTLHMGDFADVGSVEGTNLIKLIEKSGFSKDAPEYDVAYDIADMVIGGIVEDEGVSAEDIQALIYNYRKGTRTYRGYADEYSL